MNQASNQDAVPVAVRGTRRSFICHVGMFAGAAAFPLPLARAAGMREVRRSHRRILLSTQGGDRATGYAMSAKVVGRDGDYLCTWLDHLRQNQWALVDPIRGSIRHRGIVGPPAMDNHCGVAMCVAPDGKTHLIVGAHHGSFAHYVMSPAAAPAVELVEERIGSGATYPSIACDRDGTLHLTYRCRGFESGKPYPYHLMYVRRGRHDARWSEPRPLVRAAVLEHTWLTNAIEAGPDGRLHLVLSNTRKRADGAYFYGGSHLWSEDAGQSWRQFGGAAALRLPAEAAALHLIEDPARPVDRTQPREDWERQRGRGPGQYYYNKILLSNPTVDDAGRPSVILHDLLRGDASLYGWAQNGWVATPLAGAVHDLLPGCRISHAGQLSRHRDGTFEAVVTAAPAGAGDWGANGTMLVRILVAPDRTVRHSELVGASRPGEPPDWLPSLQRWSGHAPMERPALVHMRGYNAGGFDKNINSLTTGVWFELPL